MKTSAFGLILALFLSPAFAGDYQALDVTKLPKAKQTTFGLYLSAPEAYKMKSEGGAKVMFIDVRTAGEFQFIGAPAMIDQNIPYMELDDPITWDQKNGRYAMSPNSDFVGAVGSLATRMHLGKDDTVILICRSGDRSSPAANLLKEAGYTKVYSVDDGFEGDLDAAGHRVVNGWRNAGLPWSYKIIESQAYVR